MSDRFRAKSSCLFLLLLPTILIFFWLSHKITGADVAHACVRCADTPGVHLHHRLIHMLSPAELKAIHPWKKLRPYLAPAPLELAALNADEASAGSAYIMPTLCMYCIASCTAHANMGCGCTLVMPQETLQLC